MIEKIPEDTFALELVQIYEKQPASICVTRKKPFTSHHAKVLQNILNIFGYALIISYLTSSPHCMLREEVGRSYVVSALLTGAGLSYILVDIFSTKLIVSGGARLGYLVCTLIFLKLENQRCPGNGDIYAMGVEERQREWQQRIRNVQGAVVITCVIQLLVGLLGVKFLVKYVRPVSIVPTMLLISIYITKTSATTMADSCWKLFLFTSVSVLISYCIYYKLARKRRDSGILCIRRHLYIAVICVLAIWLLCILLSRMEFVESKSAARTDVYTGIMYYASNLRISYPFQWGMPQWKVEAISIILPASFISICEILANYYTSLETSGKKSGILTKHREEDRIWRWLIMCDAGFCLLATTMGTVFGVDIDLKKKHQHRTFLGIFVGIVLILIGLSGKLCAVFTLVPEPIVAVLIFVVFMSVFFEALNLSRHIEMKKSNKNLYIIGISLFLGLVVPALLRNKSRPEITGRPTLDAILMSLLTTEFFVAGFVAIFLDNLTEGFVPRNTLILVQEKNCGKKEENCGKTEKHVHEAPLSGVLDCISPFFD